MRTRFVCNCFWHTWERSARRIRDVIPSTFQGSGFGFFLNFWMFDSRFLFSILFLFLYSGLWGVEFGVWGLGSGVEVLGLGVWR